jgi:drug/metabolite transporter (DMT)-like permease
VVIDTSDERNAGMAVIAGCVAVLAWSIGPIFIRGVDSSTLTKVVYRFWMAQPAMIGAAYLTGGRLSLAMIHRAFVPGILFAGSVLATFFAFDNTSIANATLIPALQPAVFLAIAPRLFGEHSTRRQVGAGALALVGVVVFVLAGNNMAGHGWIGDLCAAADLVIWTAYFIKVKQIRNEGIHAASFLAAVFVVAGVVVTPLVFWPGAEIGIHRTSDWVRMVLIVVVPGLMGHLVMTWAQRHLTITVASLLSLGQVPLAAIGAWIVFSESLGTVQILGAAIVLIALAIIVIESQATRGASTTGTEALSITAE